MLDALLDIGRRHREDVRRHREDAVLAYAKDFRSEAAAAIEALIDGTEMADFPFEVGSVDFTNGAEVEVLLGVESEPRVALTFRSGGHGQAPALYFQRDRVDSLGKLGESIAIWTEAPVDVGAWT